MVSCAPYVALIPFVWTRLSCRRSCARTKCGAVRSMSLSLPCRAGRDGALHARVWCAGGGAGALRRSDHRGAPLGGCVCAGCATNHDSLMCWLQNFALAPFHMTAEPDAFAVTVSCMLPDGASWRARATLFERTYKARPQHMCLHLQARLCLKQFRACARSGS